MNALLDETKTRRIEPGLAFLDQLRVSPTLAAVLEDEKGADESWGAFAVRGMLFVAFMRRIMAMDILGVIRLGVRLVGFSPDEVASVLTSVRSADERQERRPLAKARA